MMCHAPCLMFLATPEKPVRLASKTSSVAGANSSQNPCE